MAGVGDTYLTQSWLLSMISWGGKIILRKSSVLIFELETWDSAFLPLPLLLKPLDTRIGVSYLSKLSGILLFDILFVLFK